MKSRQGFVSNSSSSSFVIIGAKLKQDIQNISEEKMIEIMKSFKLEYDEKYPEDSFWDYAYCEDFGGIGIVHNTNCVGKTVATWDDCTSIKEFNMKNFDPEKIKKQIKDIFGEDVDVKMYCGMTYG